jgi:hypothetical protein
MKTQCQIHGYNPRLLTLPRRAGMTNAAQCMLTRVINRETTVVCRCKMLSTQRRKEKGIVQIRRFLITAVVKNRNPLLKSVGDADAPKFIVLHVHIVHICAIVAFVAGSLLEELARQHLVRPIAAVFVLFPLATFVAVAIVTLSLCATVCLGIIVLRVVVLWIVVLGVVLRLSWGLVYGTILW